MLQPVRCIKFGEIVVDENRRLLLLCSNCHTDYNSLQEFRQHFDHCGQCERQDLFKENVSLVFPSLGATDTKQLLLSRCVKGAKEFLIYKYNGLRRMEPLMLDSCKNDDDFMDLIKIEEELLDPRWYSDLTNAPDMVYVEPHQQQLQLQQQHHQLQQLPQQTSASYNELVEAVTPYVQFKENLKNTNERNINTTTSMTTTTTTTLKKKHKILNKAANGTLSVKTLAGASVAKVKSYTNGKRRPSFVATNGGTSSIILPAAAAALPAASSTSPPPQALPSLQKLPLQQKQRIVKRNAAANKNTKPNTPPVIEAKITAASFAVAPCNNNNTQNLPVPLNTEAAAIVSLPVMPPPNIMLPAKYMQTQKILSKLQNMGLQVKRKQPPEESPKPMQDADDDPAKQQTLALLKKLQSKGMNVKIIPNAKAATGVHYSEAPPPKKMAPEELLTLNANIVQSTQLNRNLIIKKLN